jgi:dTDP-glucose pyrophosphorylase
MTDINNFKVKANNTIRKVIRQMDAGGLGFCFCVDDEDRVIGIISDGDFRRAILNGIQLEESVEKIINKNFVSLGIDYTHDDLQKIFSDGIVQHIPILDNGRMIEIITEEKFFGIKEKSRVKTLDTVVVIMAGGMGTRLDPFTRILPKPLIPIGHDPIIKVIMDEFSSHGMQKFYVTINDKGKMIKGYFHDHELEYDIKFVEEGKPLGTAGSLKFLKGTITEPFVVSNCDIIVRCDYLEILKFHNQRKNAITLVGSMQHHTVPYGVCEIENGGDLISINEKPEFDYLINTGLYIIDPEVLDYIADDTRLNMTDLITKVNECGLNVGVFPVSEKSWIDIGQWSEYKEAIRMLGA